MLERSDGDPDQWCASTLTCTPAAIATAPPSGARCAPGAGTSWAWCAQPAASRTGMIHFIAPSRLRRVESLALSTVPGLVRPPRDERQDGGDQQHDSHDR